MESKKTFGVYIAQKRKEAGLTQRGFAEKLYVTESAVSKWERGLSYPDISLIKDICEILGISEHELLTASEDTQTRNNEKLAQQYLTLTWRFKVIQIVLYGAALLTCFICNLAVDRTLSWFFIVLTSILLAASLTLLPAFLEKNRGLITLAAFTVSLLLLLFVCNVYTGGDWFVIAAVPIIFGLCVVFLPLVLRAVFLPQPLCNHKALLCFAVDTVLLLLLLFVSDRYTNGGWFVNPGLPLTAFWLIIPWGMLVILRYTKMNGWFKAAACLGLWGAVFFVSDGFMGYILDHTPMRVGFLFDFSVWNGKTTDGNIKMIILCALVCFAVTFAVTGAATARHRKS